MKRFEAANLQNQIENNPPRPVLKNYKLARRALPLQKSLNEGIEYLYHDLLKRFKEMYSSLPDPLDRTIVEINGKVDPYDPDGLFTFYTPHFYYHVRCNYLEKYEVLYQFHNCPFEAEIRKWFKRSLHTSFAFESDRIKDFPSFYKEVLAFQPKERISVLDYVAP